jgi:hypothetical protein
MFALEQPRAWLLAATSDLPPDKEPIAKLELGVSQRQPVSFAEALAKFQSKVNANPDEDREPLWFAIAEPDGKVLATSIGPLGNIGFPATIEGKRHLKRMITSTVRHITAAECDRLIQSLPKPTP